MPAPWPPPIAERELVERLALDDDGFRAYVGAFVAAVPSRACNAAAFASACAYPWARPAGSYLLDGDGGVRALGGLPRAEREALIERLAAPRAGRLPLLAIGSNAAPETLRRKFAHFDAPADRTVLAVSGRLHEFDVGYAAQPALYGALPATLFPSPGTAVATTLLWVTPAQFTQLTWSELSYRLGRLRTRFAVDGADEQFDEVLAFVSRWGAFCVDGAPVALAAVEAERRRATALTQEQALDHAARLTLGAGANAETLVRAVFADLAGLAPRLAATLHASARPFASARWTPYAG
ncbi:MAG: hypothetical protein JSS99_11140 [Actinobacteria bacterium]|nr:hypothetical protein [Actinomycetota bacterium]